MTINEWSDVIAMAEAVQNKMVSPRELVKDTISEAERTNTKINAIVSQPVSYTHLTLPTKRIV